jgi:hypothetical protein
MEVEMAKVLFTLKPHSIIDVITNSSSELFVGKAQEKQDIINMIKSAYPDYLNEYLEIKSTKELDNDDLETYISYHYNSWSNNLQTLEHNLIDGFSVEEMYDYHPNSEWDKYQLKYPLVTDKNRDKIIKGIDPNEDMYFLFSIDSNPDWDMQEKLEQFMTRYHLG